MTAVAFTGVLHTLKSHADNFDAIISGAKRCEIRHENDRKFVVGDRLRLVRTDVDGNPTHEPPRFCFVDVLWLTRMAGPLTLFGIDTRAGREEPVTIVVMSIGGTDAPTAIAAARGRR